MKRTSPIFIVGMNGSGTTMLADLLESAPGIYLFPRETRMLPWAVNKAAKLGDLAFDDNFATLYKLFCDLYAIRMTTKGQVPAMAAISDRTVGGLINAVYGHLATQNGKQRWVEKSPMNVEFMIELAHCLPDAQFVHIIRDGRDVALSNQRRWRKSPAWSMYRWVQSVRRGRKDGQTLGEDRYLEVRYEQLTNEPEKTLRTICTFCDLDYSADLLKSSMPFVSSVRRKSSTGKSGTIVPNSNKWKSAFTAGRVAQLEAVGGKLLAELGYETADANGERSPGSIQRFFWRVQDIYNNGLLYIQRFGFNRHTPGHFLRRLNEGIRYIASQK